MLSNILKAIEQKAEERINKISQEKKERLVELREEHGQSLEQKKKSARENIRKETEQEIREYQKAKELEINFKVQQKRNEILERVYQLSVERANNLPQKEFERLIKKLAKPVLPREGRIEAGKRAAAILRTIAPEKEVEAGLKEEGFIFKSPQLEIEAIFSQVLNQLREKANPGLVKILFV